MDRGILDTFLKNINPQLIDLGGGGTQCLAVVSCVVWCGVKVFEGVPQACLEVFVSAARLVRSFVRSTFFL